MALNKSFYLLTHLLNVTSNEAKSNKLNNITTDHACHNTGSGNQIRSSFTGKLIRPVITNLSSLNL